MSRKWPAADLIRGGHRFSHLSPTSRLQPAEACAEIGSRLDGLSQSEAAGLQKTYGPNLAVCTRYIVKQETGRLDASHFEAAKEQTTALNSDGFRVVAVAYKEMDPSKAT
jgi:magnesium-transporting ATPase (P-type)